ERYTGSGSITRLGAGPRRAMSGLLLRSVAGAGLLAVLHAGGVEGTAHHLVPNTGEVLHPAATHQDDAVFLEVVAFARDVCGDFHLRRQSDTGHLTKRRVRLLGGDRVDAGTDTTALRGPRQTGRVLLLRLRAPALPHQLLDRRHRSPLKK